MSRGQYSHAHNSTYECGLPHIDFVEVGTKWMCTRRGGDRQRAQGPRLDVRPRGGEWIDHERDAVRDQVGMRGGTALVRDFRHFPEPAGRLRKHQRRQLLRAAFSGGAVSDLASIVLDVLA